MTQVRPSRRAPPPTQPIRTFPRLWSRPAGPSLARLSAPALSVAIAIAVWTSWLYLHVWRRHDRFGTFDNDLGFHAQYVWQLSHGRNFSSILGLPAFGHNATFGYFLLAPFAWLGGGPQFMNFAQTLAVGLGAVPVYVLAKRRLESSWLPAILAVAYLLHPVVTGNVWETFHPETMAMTPLLAGVAAAEHSRWRQYALFLALAIVWKTDVALFIAMLGIRVARRHHKKVGLATLGLASLWFVVCISVVIPHYSGGGTVFGPLYGELGDTPFDVASSTVRDPGAVAERVIDNEPHRYARDLLVPYAFAPVLAPGTLALAAPQAAINLLAEPEFTRDPVDNPHYQALPAVALTLALLDAAARVKRRRPDNIAALVGAVAVCVVAAAIAWSALPNGVKRQHFWSEDGDPLRADRLAALAHVRNQEPTSATYQFVPHLTRRQDIYSFPNPWMKVFYGVENTPLPDPAVVEFLVIDRTLLDETKAELFDCIVTSRSFRRIYVGESGQIEVWQRIADRIADRACQRT